MTRDELEKHNIAENLDALMNLDPRGYGVCRILYAGARAFTGGPVAMHAAEKLCAIVQPGDTVLILVGFVLLPHRVPEMDGTVSAMLLARAMVLAFQAKPVIVCPPDSVEAIKKCAAVVGLHIYEDIATVKELPLSMGVISFTKDAARAPAQADEIIAAVKPAAVVSVEASGANAKGEYHNAVGKNVTVLQAKTDILFTKLQELGVLNIAIGDLGNEIGMGALAAHIKKYVPFTAPGECQCGCGGGILAATAADNVITATCSDWGCYALMAALAYLKRNIEILHREEMESEVMRVAARSGFIDMTGSLLPGIDGFNTRLNVSIVTLMRQCTGYALQYSHNSDHWFGPVLAKKFFG
jgi:hypothetical protein